MTRTLTLPEPTPPARHRMLADVNLLLHEGDRILLLRRAGTGWMDGCYGFVAGHVEAGETFLEAMVREGREEAGIDLDPVDLALVLTMHRRSDVERMSLFFAASRWQGQPANAEPDKCDDLGWFPRSDLPAPMIGYVRAALDAVDAGLRYVEFQGY